MTGQIGRADRSAPGRWKVSSLEVIGSSGPKPDHPDLLSAEKHYLAGSSGVTQDDPTLCKKIVQECFVSDNSLYQMVKHFQNFIFFWPYVLTMKKR